MKKLPNHTALKEWSTVIDALGRGEQVILIRKGGIADPKFGVEAPQFYLYPTYFHQGEDEARRGVTITHWCEVVRTWSTRDAEMLDRLAPLVVALPRETLEARYRFRPDQALHVIGVRTYVLARPVEVIFRDEYAGCRSWLSVDEEIDVDGSRPVLSDADLRGKLSLAFSLGEKVARSAG
ncbi:MAG TPA: DUF1802 family protein [Thermoanaerobaculia bacterium]|jgi:hypothetical protein|nr:DUF1802 family protein [Thermoanaerobaculia bacterium]